MDNEATDYFAEGSRWELDRADQQRRSARRAWWVAAGAATVASIASAAVLMLTPLKHVEPFVVRVDNATGLVDVVPLYTGKSELPETVTRHLVTEYVTQRERYIPALAETDYDQIGAYHSAAMNQAWASAWARANPESPLVRYGETTRVRASVEAVSFLKRVPAGPEVVQVRFMTSTQRGAGASEELGRYVATLEVMYGPPSVDVRMRALNPLGFKVVEYHREPVITTPGVVLSRPAEAGQGGTP